MAEHKKDKGKSSTPVVEKKDCPKSLEKLCTDLNEWAAEWEDWGKTVVMEFDKCCGSGGPDILPPPPKPPFK